MKKEVWLHAADAITSLGFSIPEQVEKIAGGHTGIREWNDPSFSPFPFFASLVSHSEINRRFGDLGDTGAYTRLEKLMILSMHSVLQTGWSVAGASDTLLIITTTKGNIDVLEGQQQEAFPASRAYLGVLGRTLKNFFQLAHDPLIISNACVSGVMGVIAGARQIRHNRYRNVIVCGGDLVTAFTVAGFQSFKAIGTTPCRPYDVSRDGLSLGEGAGTILLSADKPASSNGKQVRVLGGAISNDANHISGPSRDGIGLASAMQHALKESGMTKEDLGYISTHGTATPYNDEMECKALYASGLGQVPLNSFKGAIGHTLGAAGVIELGLAADSLLHDRLLPSTGYNVSGVTLPLQVIKKTEHRPVRSLLKTASGFGGCNASVVLSN